MTGAAQKMGGGIIKTASMTMHRIFEINVVVRRTTSFFGFYPFRHIFIPQQNKKPFFGQFTTYNQQHVNPWGLHFRCITFQQKYLRKFPLRPFQLLEIAGDIELYRCRMHGKIPFVNYISVYLLRTASLHESLQYIYQIQQKRVIPAVPVRACACACEAD